MADVSRFLHPEASTPLHTLKDGESLQPLHARTPHQHHSCWYDPTQSPTHVPGGFDVTSYTTLFTPFTCSHPPSAHPISLTRPVLTSFVIRDDIRLSTAGGNENLPRVKSGLRKGRMVTHQSAVMKSSVCTARNATTCLIQQCSNAFVTHLIICPRIPGHAHRLDGQERDESLADLVVQPCSADLLDVDVIGLLQDFDLLACDLA